MTIAGQRQRPVGQLLREWRERRRLSQLELAIQADISTRHLSFVETGRAMPSRDMVLRLAEQLDVPLRERNHLLLAAGYAPIYPRTPLDSPALAAVRAAVRQLLTAHQPYPAIAVDRRWYLAEANASIGLFTAGVAAPLLTPPVNALRLALHPAGLAPRIVNLGEWRTHLLGRLRRQVAQSGDAELTDLYDELRGYPCDQPEPEVELPGPGEVVVPLRIRDGDRELAFFSTVSTFGTPLDVTVAELSVESFFPLDDYTAAAVRTAAEHEEERVGSVSAR
ncbi:helix-turn-helix transcriptional regulator [Plantactinospora sp. B6F1]|uniref:MmyB family transcriptional regulator n=1 Tax=Plantactinospora sp. B6F1 TaxID=3158971 RepID=UPI00102B21A9